MKKYEYAGIDVSTEKSAADAATCYIEAVRRYMELKTFQTLIQSRNLGIAAGRRKQKRRRKER